MQRFFLFLIILILPALPCSRQNMVLSSPQLPDCLRFYSEMQLLNHIDYKAFEEAYIGYSQIKSLDKDILTLIDFTKPSTEERLYVLDMRQRKILYISHVSHGRNSGENYATSFSNISGSYKSSLGFYLTENTYQGKNGYSLVLDGLEKGVNDRAKERAIVIHGAPYSNPSVIQYTGRLGRSQGCPALPQAVSEKIINTIKGGSLVYIYADNADYYQKSAILTKHS